MLTGADLDLGRLPIPTYFPGDAGRYLTAGMLVARDPETGVETEGYHRFQVKGRDRMGVSLHSRRRMFEYQRRAEARGQALPCAVALGLHPLVSMGSLAYPPAEVGKFEVVGGLFGEPLEVARCTAIDLTVPAAAEIVIEGEILPGVREPEGPFGEFTGYFSRRSHRARLPGEGDLDADEPLVPVDRLRPRGRPHHDPRRSCARRRSGTRSGA